MSFFKYIEVIGSEKILLDFLHWVLPDFQLSRLDEITSNATEINLLFYDKQFNPHQCVGPVSVFFVPIESSKGNYDVFWFNKLRKCYQISPYFYCIDSS